MPTATYQALANFTLSTAATSITFSSIPATYRDLILVFQGKTTSNSALLSLRINNDSTSTYSFQYAAGRGGSNIAASGTNVGSAKLDFEARASSITPMQVNVNLIDYSATDKVKTLINRADQWDNGTEIVINSWPSTAAISSLTLLASNTLAAGSTAALYGVIA